MERMWMVRAEAGTLYDLFRERAEFATHQPRGFCRRPLRSRPRGSALTLSTQENLNRALVNHYDTTAIEAKRLAPLKRIYRPT
jgi:predicted Mrr-cat superfamily restriction endonuclease